MTTGTHVLLGRNEAILETELGPCPFRMDQGGHSAPRRPGSVVERNTYINSTRAFP